MSKSGNFAQKVAELQKSLEEGAQKTGKIEKCFPTLMVVGIAIPFLMLILLFFLQPSFVQRQEGDKMVRDGRRIFYWTVAMTLIAWFGMYMYTYCTGYNATSMLCSK